MGVYVTHPCCWRRAHAASVGCIPLALPVGIHTIACARGIAANSKFDVFC